MSLYVVFNIYMISLVVVHHVKVLADPRESKTLRSVQMNRCSQGRKIAHSFVVVYHSKLYSKCDDKTTKYCRVLTRTSTPHTRSAITVRVILVAVPGKDRGMHKCDRTMFLNCRAGILPYFYMFFFLFVMYWLRNINRYNRKNHIIQFSLFCII